MNELDPNVLETLGHHVFALEVAIERLSKATKKPIDPLFQSVLTEGKARYEQFSPDQTKEMLTAMLQRLDPDANLDQPQG
jgi:hypothetical protein